MVLLCLMSGSFGGFALVLSYQCVHHGDGTMSSKTNVCPGSIIVPLVTTRTKQCIGRYYRPTNFAVLALCHGSPSLLRLANAASCDFSTRLAKTLISVT